MGIHFVCSSLPFTFPGLMLVKKKKMRKTSTEKKMQEMFEQFQRRFEGAVTFAPIGSHVNKNEMVKNWKNVFFFFFKFQKMSERMAQSKQQLKFERHPPNRL